MITEQLVLQRIAEAVNESDTDSLAAIHNDLTNHTNITGNEIEGQAITLVLSD